MIVHSLRTLLGINCQLRSVDDDDIVTDHSIRRELWSVLATRMLAMITASRPTLWSVASIRIQRRVTVSGLKNVVFIHILLENSLVDYHKPAISQRLEAANNSEPICPERVRAAGHAPVSYTHL